MYFLILRGCGSSIGEHSSTYLSISWVVSIEDLLKREVMEPCGLSSVSLSLLSENMKKYQKCYLIVSSFTKSKTVIPPALCMW